MTLSILVAGLGRFANKEALALGKPKSAAAATALKTSIAAQLDAGVEASNKAGYHVERTELNPADPTSIAALSELLQSRKWDGFMIGYGLRGVFANTPLFEQVVNLSREVAPETRLLFSNTPDEVLVTIERSFGKKR
ncbi:Hypothetical protein R9X50_00356300 [Acrodontium crateriforme]|uniref:Uncharacterized protein n=1 Tax=Acrodontium crateriforme TaxID=150365 RepID=A0AAQ3RBY8_9PEZI|nr:Hypothetical protein R9X50_00356300 [Acrodontium crateriforme]